MRHLIRPDDERLRRSRRDGLRLQTRQADSPLYRPVLRKFFFSDAGRHALDAKAHIREKLAPPRARRREDQPHKILPESEGGLASAAIVGILLSCQDAELPPHPPRSIQQKKRFRAWPVVLP
jgi:hypothetical protein